MGILVTIGQWVGIKALRLGEASIIGNVQYMQLIYGAILGFFMFNEIPDIYTVVGALVIIGSSLYMFHRKAIAQKRPTK